MFCCCCCLPGQNFIHRTQPPEKRQFHTDQERQSFADVGPTGRNSFRRHFVQVRWRFAFEAALQVVARASKDVPRTKRVHEASRPCNNSCMYSYECGAQCTHFHAIHTCAFLVCSVSPHRYHVEYTTDLGFPEEKTALSWSFRADLTQRSLLLRPGIDDGVPTSVPTHTVLRAHVVRAVCASFLAFVAFVAFPDTVVFLSAAYCHEWGSRLVVADSCVESRGVVRHR